MLREIEDMIDVVLEIHPVFTRWQVSCKKCGNVFYVDTEPNSIGEEIAVLEDIHCGLHPCEGSVIELV
jgi:hypothetical protein